MRLVIKKNELLNALQIVSRAVPTRTTKQILYGIKLTASTTELYICAYDLENGIEMSISNKETDDEDVLQIEQSGSIVLNSKYLLEIVRKLPHFLVRFDVIDTIVTILSGTATYTINGMDSREFPPLPEVSDERGFSMPCSTLQSMINHTAFAVATSESRPTLTGVLWKYDQGKLSLTATDSHRLSTEEVIVESQKEYAFIDSIIPGKSLNELAKILPDTDLLADIMIANNQLLVLFLNIKFYSRLIEGKYPEIARIIPTVFRTTITIQVKQFIDCIERSALMARDTENQLIRIHLRRTTIEVTSHSPEIGKISETLDPKTFEGEDLILSCNSKFLLDALRAIDKEDVRIEFTGQGSAFILQPVADVHHLQLILPVRVANS